jgi:hypothetical protein
VGHDRGAVKIQGERAVSLKKVGAEALGAGVQGTGGRAKYARGGC